MSQQCNKTVVSFQESFKAHSDSRVKRAKKIVQRYLKSEEPLLEQEHRGIKVDKVI